MPRDLQSLKGDSQPSNESPKPVESPASMTQDDEDSMVKKISETHGSSNRDKLHPYTQCLTVNDVESCTVLEEAAFPPEERCTKEKVSHSALCYLARRRCQDRSVWCARCCHTCRLCVINVRLALLRALSCLLLASYPVAEMGLCLFRRRFT